jgi:superfamily I DNA/RNA helicase/RecB family exonuclease
MTPGTRIEPQEWDRILAETDGPQLVVAGPGTGKTEFLVRRARFLLASGRAEPGQILVLTFSRRAAADLARRIAAQGGSQVPASTFHSFAHRLLELSGRAAFGWSEVPSLLTSPEQVALVAELLAAEDPGDWPLSFRGLLRSPSFAEEIADFVLRCQERLLGPAQLAVLAADHPPWRAIPGFLQRYTSELARRHRLDYGGLLAAAVACAGDRSVQPGLTGQFRFVLVDEYQDTSIAQAALLDRLTIPHRNLTVAADPYQSVYSFRGAEIGNVAEFPDRFRDPAGHPARRWVLSTSFRVPSEIMASALRIVSSGDLPGAAGEVTPAPHAGRVEAYVFDQASAEAEYVAREVEHLHREEGVGYDRMAVLVRSSRHLLPELSRALERRRIPHDTPDHRLNDHPALRIVADLVAAARAEGDHLAGRIAPGTAGDADRSVRRLLLGPLYRMSLGRERRILGDRQRTGDPWSEVLARQAPETRALAGLLASPAWATALPAADGFWEVWTTLHEMAALVADGAFDDYPRVWGAFSQVLDRLYERSPTSTLADYWDAADRDDFEAVPLLSLAPPRQHRLTLTTLHQAKGLEFEVVFLADATEGVFPDLRRSRGLLRPELLSGDGSARFRLQEEMRLAYTAMTRARTRVVWTATSAAIDEGERRPSRFLLAAAGVREAADLGPPVATRPAVPVSLSEAQALLRHTLTDPTQPAPLRLAAADQLAHPPRPGWDVLTFPGVAERGPDTGVVKPPLYLSPSQADTYADCPRRYVLERFVIPAAHYGSYARFGSLIHRVLERAEAEAAAAGWVHAEAGRARQILDEVWQEEADFGTPVMTEAWRQRGVKLIDELYASWPGGEAIPIRLELDVEMELHGHHWRGRIDRVDQHRPGELRVVDYKTTKSMPTMGEAAGSLQLGFYLLAVAAHPDLVGWGKPTAAEFWYPLAKGARHFDPAKLPEVSDRLQDIGSGISAEEWTARPGSHCRTCDVQLVCPAWPEGREGYLP